MQARVRTPIYERINDAGNPVQYAVNAQGVVFRRFFVRHLLRGCGYQGPWADRPGHWDAWEANMGIISVPADAYKTNRFAFVRSGGIDNPTKAGQR